MIHTHTHTHTHTNAQWNIIQPKKAIHLQQHGWAVKSPSRVQLFATPWTVTCQAPPSMGFSRQEY